MRLDLCAFENLSCCQENACDQVLSRAQACCSHTNQQAHAPHDVDAHSRASTNWNHLCIVLPVVVAVDWLALAHPSHQNLRLLGLQDRSSCERSRHIQIATIHIRTYPEAMSSFCSRSRLGKCTSTVRTVTRTALQSDHGCSTLE